VGIASLIIIEDAAGGFRPTVAGDRITEACHGLTPSRSLRKAKSLGFVPFRTIQLGKTEHNKVAVFAAQGVGELRCGQGRRRGKYHVTILEAAHLFGREPRDAANFAEGRRG
jgi:hypothetical protein